MFKEALEKIVEKTDGSIGALIMGADGLSVETFFPGGSSETNLDVAAAEFTSVVQRASKSAADLDLGKLKEMVIHLDRVTFILRFFSRDYFVLLALAADGNVGRARYELRKAELVLAKEFALN